MSARDEKQRLLYKFLITHARDQSCFSVSDLQCATGWLEATAKTYLAKQLKTVIKKRGSQYEVASEFIYLSEEDFVHRTSQLENILPKYKRTRFDWVINYEFLMPLSRELILRQNLDQLFYKDAITNIVTDVGLDRFATVVPREGAPDTEYAQKVARVASSYFAGYSIVHVAGRFRAGDLRLMSDGFAPGYVIDETTAVVRFIVPLKFGALEKGSHFSANIPSLQPSSEAEKEMRLIRTLFFQIFAEVVVHSIQGELEIWLLETVAGTTRLYKWEEDQA